MLHSKRQSL